MAGPIFFSGESKSCKMHTYQRIRQKSVPVAIHNWFVWTTFCLFFNWYHLSRMGMLWGVSWVVGQLWGVFEVIELKYRHPRSFPQGYSNDVLVFRSPVNHLFSMSTRIGFVHHEYYIDYHKSFYHHVLMSHLCCLGQRNRNKSITIPTKWAARLERFAQRLITVWKKDIITYRFGTDRHEVRSAKDVVGMTVFWPPIFVVWESETVRRCEWGWGFALRGIVGY
jgi:hypothetical protein